MKLLAVSTLAPRPGLEPRTPPLRVRTGEDAIARSWEARGTPARDTFVAALFARLVKAGAIPEDATLDSPVPASIRAQAGATYRTLLGALSRDADEDGRFDVDTLLLASTFARTPPARLIRALADPAEVDLDAPADLGLGGHTELDRWRQQLALRTGAILVDSGDVEGALDPADALELVDPRTNRVTELTVAALRAEVVDAMRFNMATVRVAERYAAQTEHMRFSAGEGEAVNTDLWTVSTAETPRGRQTSWELNPGRTPAEALDDVLGGGARRYSTECAHARTLLRLGGLLEHDRETFGDAGELRFNARFAVDPGAEARVIDYLARWDRSRESFAEYSARTPPPELAYALEVSRHWIYGAGERPAAVFTSMSGAPAPGDDAYFHNHGVSVSGVEAGWVGENVIDLGFREGTQRWFGHPGGIDTEAGWKKALASSMIDSMADYADYFTPRVSELSWDQLGPAVEALRAEIAELERARPAGWEAAVEERRSASAELQLLHAARIGFGESLPYEGIAVAAALLDAPERIRGAQDLVAIAEHFAGPAQARLRSAFARLAPEVKALALAGLGLDEAELYPEELAAAALAVVLLPGGVADPQRFAELRALLEVAEKGAELRPGGRLASKGDLQAWLDSARFTEWYEEAAGEPWTGPRRVDALSVEAIAGLIELLLPEASGAPTIYAATNGGTALLAQQMATFLKEGRLPDAEYRPEPAMTPR